MKTTIIPAQITTVEDKIAGNLNLVQIIMLMIPVFWTTIVYSLFPPTLRVVLYKLPLIFVMLTICCFLSLRIRGKVMLNWLFILFAYNFRASYYVYDKNDPTTRTMDSLTFEEKQKKVVNKIEQKQKVILPQFSVKDLVQIDTIFANPRYSFSVKAKKKGGMYVSVEQVKT